MQPLPHITGWAPQHLGKWYQPKRYKGYDREENFIVPKVNIWQYKVLEREMKRMYTEESETQTAMQCEKEEDKSVAQHFVCIHL